MPASGPGRIRERDQRMAQLRFAGLSPASSDPVCCCPPCGAARGRIVTSLGRAAGDRLRRRHADSRLRAACALLQRQLAQICSLRPGERGRQRRHHHRLHPAPTWTHQGGRAAARSGQHGREGGEAICARTHPIGGGAAVTQRPHPSHRWPRPRPAAGKAAFAPRERSGPGSAGSVENWVPILGW